MRSRTTYLTALLATLVVGTTTGSVMALGSGDDRVLGLPKDESVLFAFNAKSGSLDPQHKDRFTLVLRGLDERGLWFADRPNRDSGTVPTRGFFGKWTRLGFAADPPNAALTIEGAPEDEDAVALELEDPRFRRSSESVRLDVRVLEGPSAGLAHLVSKLDEDVDREFGRASLFVDNAAAGSAPCVIGEIDYFAAAQAADYDGQEFPSALPANGKAVDIADYPDLFGVIGTKFGGDGQTTFALPNLDSLVPGVVPLICFEGYFPSPANPDLAQCLAANVELFSGEFVPNGYVRTDGGVLKIADRPILYALLGTRFGGDGETTFGVPNLAAPQGLVSAICAQGDYWSSTQAPPLDCILSGVDQFATTDLPNSEAPANGATVAVNQNQALYSLLGNRFGGTGTRSFGLPNVVAEPGTSWGICQNGIYPEFAD
jgi:microcystin-dependent protein